MKWFYDPKPKDYAMAALLGAVGGIDGPYALLFVSHSL